MFVSLNTWQSIISKTGQKKASEIVDYWRKGRGGGTYETFSSFIYCELHE